MPDESMAACPESWFAKTMEEVGLVEQTGCSLIQLLYELPVEVRNRHLAYKSVMDKAKPYLEEIAKARAG
ncbi:MAG TPA: hypothetical protein VNM48_03620 [Chloroflexota bacterium]|nr:hypothetical protein [Chloroflexota bacterium]